MNRECPGCGLIMSEREAREQGACDACRPDCDCERPATPSKMLALVSEECSLHADQWNVSEGDARK